MKDSCSFSACIYCDKYSSCKKRTMKKCKCGGNPGTRFKLIGKGKKNKRIDVVVECMSCGKKTPVFKYEYEAINAWNKGDIK